MVNYTLSNAEELSRENPLSFDIPPRAERGSLKEGDTVKLIFDETERMWVTITKSTEAGYIGVLVNIPSAIKTIAKDDEVEFGPEHIIDIWEANRTKFDTEDSENLQVVSSRDNAINKSNVLH
jgi:hypothetical protein